VSKILYLRLTEDPYWSEINALTASLHWSVARVGLEALQLGLKELARQASLDPDDQGATMAIADPTSVRSSKV
jgi:hypothetical protein